MRLNSNALARPSAENTLLLRRFFPFLDSLWFGESFHYNSPADTFLVEISGLPFGLFGDMLGSESHGAHRRTCEASRH